MNEQAILIVEDDEDIVQVLQFALEEQGYAVEAVGDGASAVERAAEGTYQLIILDLMLPRLNGIEVCKKVRQSGNRVPIMMLTSKADDLNKVLGLELGADDYVTKPFSIMEVVARVKALIRRAAPPEESTVSKEQGPQELSFHELRIDLTKRRVWLAERRVELTRHEYDLLLFLATNPGRPFTREQILSQVWECEYAGYENTISSHVNRLRNKIETDPANPYYIRTVRGIGYRFVDAEDGAN